MLIYRSLWVFLAWMLVSMPAVAKANLNFKDSSARILAQSAPGQPLVADRDDQGDRSLVAGLQAYAQGNPVAAAQQWKLALQAYRQQGNADGVMVSLFGLRQADAADQNYSKLLKAELLQLRKQQRQNPSLPKAPKRDQTLYQTVGLALLYPLLDDTTQSFLPLYTDWAKAQVTGQSPVAPLMAIAQHHLAFGDAARSVQIYEQALQANQATLSPDQRREIEKNLTQGYFVMGENARAIEFHQRKLANVAPQPVNSATTAAPYLNLARSYAAIGQYPKALWQYQSLYHRAYLTCPSNIQVSTAESNCQDAIEKTLFNNNAYTYATAGNYSAALKDIDKSKSVQKRINRRNALGFIYDILRMVDYLSKQDQAQEDRNSANRPIAPQAISGTDKIIIDVSFVLLRDIFSSNLVIARSEQYVSGQVSVLIGLGRIHASVGEYAEALERYKEGLILSRQSGDRQREWASLVGISRAYESLGDLNKAQAHYQQSLELAKTIKQQDPQHAEVEMQSAYRALGEYGQAIRFYQRSLELAQAQSDSSRVVQALVGLGQSYEALDQRVEGASYYQQAMQVATMPKQQLIVQMALGKSEYERGNYEKAKAIAAQIRTLAQAVQDVWAEHSALTLVGEIAFLQGDVPGAVRHHQLALALAQTANLQAQYQNQDNIKTEFSTMLTLGKAEFQAGNTSTTLTHYQKALNLAQKLDPASQITAHQNLGQVYTTQKNSEAALESYQKALKLTYSPQDLKAESLVLTNLGTLQYQLGNFKEAEKRLFDALKIQEILQRKTDDRNRISVSETQQTAYDVLQQTLVAQKKYDTALAVAERSRARTFADQLTKRLYHTHQPEAKIIDLAAPKTQDQGFQPLSLDQMRDLANRRKSTLVVYSIVQTAQAGFEAASQKPHEATLYIWVIKPDRTIAFRSVEASVIRDRWAKLQVQQTCESHRDSALNNLVSCLVETMQMQIGVRSLPGAGGGGGRSPKANGAALSQLHELLVQPIADLLPTDIQEPVTIVPQGALFFVPFPALKDAKGQYLIETQTLSIAPSLSSLALSTQIGEKNAKQSEIPRTDLIVGNPTMPAIAGLPGQPAIQLRALPGAEQEAKSIAVLLNSQPLIGAQATKSAVLARFKTARRIHLATHGFFDEVRGTGSAIALAPESNALTAPINAVTTASAEQKLFANATRDGVAPNLFNQEVNGFLTAQEISGQSLRADLVVLSACNTGQGRITGDGVIGLSRSFLTAGAASIVVSLWAVPDSPTAQLMEQFYANLQTTPNKAQALRQAMLKTKESRPNPRDWAAFTLIGATD